MKAVLASNNKHKLVEIKTMLKDKIREIYTLKDMGIEIEIEENGTTFEQNAYIKASTIAKLTGLPAIGDDSGICVEALNGEPNIYSARSRARGASLPTTLTTTKHFSTSSTHSRQKQALSTERRTFRA